MSWGNIYVHIRIFSSSHTIRRYTQEPEKYKTQFVAIRPHRNGRDLKGGDESEEFLSGFYIHLCAIFMCFSVGFGLFILRFSPTKLICLFVCRSFKPVADGHSLF